MDNSRLVYAIFSFILFVAYFLWFPTLPTRQHVAFLILLFLFTLMLWYDFIKFRLKT